MTGGETAFLFGIMATVILLDLFACEGWFIPRAWDAIKRFIRGFAEAMADLFMLDHGDDPWVREPDWADAAEEVGFILPMGEPIVDAGNLWTAAEREAFDLDATTNFIAMVDRDLAAHDKALTGAQKATEWNNWVRSMELSEEQIRAEQERNKAALEAQKRHAEKMARRNGANLLPDDEDDVAALRVLNRTHPSRERRREARLG